ncbi:killer cell lectin-like receptor subfamily G member 1 isoform 2-T2 [Macrochelys suwanniensis]
MEVSRAETSVAEMSEEIIYTSVRFSRTPPVCANDIVTNRDSSCPGCPDQWLSYRSSCYFFSKMRKDWNSSQVSCSAEGSHLLVISDVKKMDLFLGMHIDSHWIGLRNSKGIGWTWEDGSKLNNTKVISNSPVQHCGVLWKGALQASSCAVPFPWICEKSPK